MRIVLILLITVYSYSSNISLWQVLNMEAEKTYGVKYASLKSQLEPLPEFKLFIDELNGGKKVKVKNKLTTFKTIRVPNHKKIFQYLKTMSVSESNTLPSYYAFLLARVSRLDTNNEFNEKYGNYFSLKLVNSNMCEGYYWRGSILSYHKQQWKKSLEAFKKASLVCNGKYKHKAKLQIAKLKYLLSNTKAKGQ